jgi:tetratricopeptide (TPR) repeat protein
LERAPDSGPALMGMGNCLLEMGRPTAAAYCFRKLMHLEPEAAGAYHNLAVCYFLNGRFDEGIELCQRALELKPDYVLAMHKLALAYLHQGRTAEGARMLHDAEAVDPDNPAIQELLRRLRWYRLTSWIRISARWMARGWRGLRRRQSH